MLKTFCKTILALEQTRALPFDKDYEFWEAQNSNGSKKKAFAL